MQRSCLLSLALILGSFSGSAATTGINSSHTDNFAYDGAASPSPILNEFGTTLALGSVIQMGYFTITDVSDPLIWDTFVPLTGDGSNNSGTFDTRIGDGTDSLNAGYWSFGIGFDDGIHSDLPTVGGAAVRVGIRIFNGSTEAGSSHYNTVTSNDSGWLMPAPSASPQPSANASIDGFPTPPLTWESGATGTFQTALTTGVAAVPEASEALIFLFGLASILRHRRR